MESQFGGNSEEIEANTSQPPGISPPASPSGPNDPGNSAFGAETDVVTPADVTAPAYVAPNAPVPPVFAPPAGTTAGGPPGADYLSTWQPPTKKGPSRSYIVLALAFCAALVAGILVFVTSGGSTTAAIRPAALVQASAQKTLGERTADVQLSGSINAAGITVPISGSGKIDFVNRDVSLTMQTNIEGTSLSINEIFVGGNLYEQLSYGSSGSAQKWIEIQLPETSNGVELGDGDGDPASQLQLLTQQGATVEKIGTETIDGVLTTEYSVVPSRQELVDGIKRELSSENLPSELKQELQTYEQSPPSLSMDVWIDASGLMRRMTIKVAMSVPGASGEVSENIVMTLDNFGSPVDISAPPSSDVESLSSLYSYADRAAESNLTNALTEARALYQVNQEYGSATSAYTASDFSEQAPEFDWTPGACGPSPANCISFSVLDVSASGDHQGLALAVYSSTGTCWYAIDVESNPARINGDSSAVWRIAGGGANSSLSAGVWYAKSPRGQTQNSCSASSVLHSSGHAAWAQSYSSAGSL
jgi:hypothetical protein